MIRQADLYASTYNAVLTYTEKKNNKTYDFGTLRARYEVRQITDVSNSRQLTVLPDRLHGTRDRSESERLQADQSRHDQLLPEVSGALEQRPHPASRNSYGGILSAPGGLLPTHPEYRHQTHPRPAASETRCRRPLSALQAHPPRRRIPTAARSPCRHPCSTWESRPPPNTPPRPRRSRASPRSWGAIPAAASSRIAAAR